MKQQRQVEYYRFVNLSLKPLMLFLIKTQVAFSTTPMNIEKQIKNHSCYTCVEPLVGYSQWSIDVRNSWRKFLVFFDLADFPDSCRFFNKSSSIALSYIQPCTSNNPNEEFECRKLIISHRSVDTYLRRDCVPKGQCSWKDKTQAMKKTPVSNCVFTDDDEQRLECIYCCDTPLCNQVNSCYYPKPFVIVFLFISRWKIFST